MPRVLDAELDAYSRHRDELLASSEGKFVLVHGAEVIGAYDAEIDAIAQGYERFGNVPFLVKQVLRIDIPQNFVSNLIA